ncbi:aminotransferase class I/II-fold pyridoxal phosphate-dependent enzyme [Streptomyces sp. CSDS2]|uniref:pyridoxal phosphate-dependent aminotransferase n=1 Tax=Streptomyces sp. CSDS2 TaxID=3055051 RepID=UPI0025B231A0|nr:aminotransferase class I/II-fold pyridoxal phosphate-dependent enzyme [Streptomyces sp. CSDS2]MDN3260516.1 aminotransferase class I/II-fold pyridoxal phosphate-dependent enzyme [Streptomyces sp. CSDS2]
MNLNLTWTGNQFLDAREQADVMRSATEAVDVTNRGDVWSNEVAAAVAARFYVPERYVRVGAGATQLIDTLLRGAYQGLVVDVTPNFHLTATISRQQNWNYRSVPVREPEELLPALEPYLDRPEAIIVLCSPRNPLGYQFATRDIAALLDRARGLVVVDEVYADFAPDTALRLVERFPRLVVMRTFSKAWGLANLRIGFAVSQAFAREDFPFWLMPNSVSGVAQATALRLLADPEAIEESVGRTLACRQLMTARLKEIEGIRIWPSDANYICVETPHAAEIVEELRAAGYLTRLLHDLKDYPEEWPAGVRISVPRETEIDTVVRCVATVQAALDEQSRTDA